MQDEGHPAETKHLPKLDPLTERLISPRIPYMQIRRLRRKGITESSGKPLTCPLMSIQRYGFCHDP
jgi:hypothetical protein